MSIILIPFTFSAGAVIIASQHNSNFSTIFSDYNGNIDNTNIVAAAGIVYSKLTLTGGIVNADVSASAAIVGSKLSLVSPGAIGSTTPSTGAFSTLKVGTTNQGDILYDNGTSLVRLTPGTSGQFLKTQGASANPIWAAGPGLQFVSKTTVATASNTGDITISDTDYYKVVIDFSDTLSGNDTLAIRFNNNTGANYDYEFDGRTTGGAITGGASGATSIIMNSSAQASRTLNAEFSIYPKGSGSYKFVSGTINYIDSAGGLITRLCFGGGSSNSVTSVVSFRILTSGGSNVSGSVYLYKYSLS